MFAETALFSRTFLSPFGNGFRLSFGNSVLLSFSSDADGAPPAIELRGAQAAQR
jgi:hypothetical protein